MYSQWPTENTSTKARYYSVGEAQGDLSLNIARLFTSDENRAVPLEACQVDSHGNVMVNNTLGSLEELDTFLRHDNHDRTPEQIHMKNLQISSKPIRRATLFLLFQRHSRAALEISYQSFQRLLCYLNAFPELYEIFRAFGERRLGVEDEGWAGYYSNIQPEPDHAPDYAGARSHDPEVLWTCANEAGTYQFESCYILRHVEKHSEGWSIRKSGFYQKYSMSSVHSFSLVTEPSRALQSQLATVFKPMSSQAADYAKHWTTFTLICLGSVSSNWRAYINYLAYEIEQIHTNLKFEQLRNTSQSEISFILNAASVTFADLRNLQLYMDTTLHAIHVLGLNLDIFEAISKDCKKLRHLEAHAVQICRRYDDLEKVLETRSREHLFCKKSLESLYKRAENISQMIGNAIALRDSTSMRELTQISASEASEVHALTQKTVEDTSAMKLLTFMAILYLPASFTSSFFGMGYVEVTKKSNGRLSLEASNGLWLFCLVTIPLTLLTFLMIWYWAIWKKRSLAEAQPTGVLMTPYNGLVEAECPCRRHPRA